MTELKYVITDELGIHARPAGLLVKQAAAFGSDVKIAVLDSEGNPKKLVDAKRIMGVMGLGAKQGDTISMTFEGDDEGDALNAVESFLKETL